jgi:hypothetical protein
VVQVSDSRSDEPQPGDFASSGSASETDGADETQEERAMRALRAIWGGADLTEEAMKLSNEFTDQNTARFTAWFRRVVLRRDG